MVFERVAGTRDPGQPWYTVDGRFLGGERTSLPGATAVPTTSAFAMIGFATMAAIVT